MLKENISYGDTMKKILFFIVLTILCFSSMKVFGEEQVDLTTPYIADPREASSMTVQFLALDWKTSTIQIKIGYGDITQLFTYSGTEARNLMVALNKMDLRTNTLNKRILNKLINDGQISGTVSGTPE